MQFGIQGDAIRDVRKLDNRLAHHERDLASAIDRDDRLRIDAAGIRDRAGGLRDRHRLRIGLILERLAAEIHGEGARAIAPEDDFKRNLICDPGIVKATLPIGKGDFPAALEPPADGRNLRRIGQVAFGGEDHIVVNIVRLQDREAAGPAGDVGIGGALGRDRNGWLFRDVDAIVRAALSVPFKPVVHGMRLPSSMQRFLEHFKDPVEGVKEAAHSGNHENDAGDGYDGDPLVIVDFAEHRIPPNHARRRPLPRCWRLVSDAISTARECTSWLSLTCRESTFRLTVLFWL